MKRKTNLKLILDKKEPIYKEIINSKKSTKLLFCIDFDGTIVKGNLNNYLAESNRIESEKHYTNYDSSGTTLYNNSLVDRFLSDSDTGWNYKEKFVQMIKNVQSEGHNIAVTSFNNYPEAIKYTLDSLVIEKLLTKEEVEKIHIAHLPECKNDKQNHIEEAKKHFKVYNTENIILVDDDIENINRANDNNIKTILVLNNNDSHFTKSATMLEEYKSLSKKQNVVQSQSPSNGNSSGWVR